MYKKIISMLLVLGLLAGLCIFPVSAAETGHTDHCVCGGAAMGVHDHQCEAAVWQPCAAAGWQ